MSTAAAPDAAAAALRAALGEARRERARLRRDRVPAPDSAHLIFAAAEPGALTHVFVQMPASPYEGARGRPRFRDVATLRAFLDEVARDAPALRDRLAPDRARGPLLAMLFCHAMAGTGAELQVVGIAHSAGEIPWEIIRAPSDGGPISLGTDADEAAVRAAFGRELTLAAAWNRALTRARSGETVLEEVEPGYWLYASGTAGDEVLEARVRDVLAAPGRWQRVDLRRPGPHAASLEPDHAQWLPEFSAEIKSGALRAVALIDAAAAEARLVGVIEHRGLRVTRRPGDPTAFVTDGELHWPADVDLLVTAAVVLGQYLDESAAAFVGVISASLERLRTILAAVRTARPQHRFELDGITAWPTAPDGTPGRPLSLLNLVARWGPGSMEFDREIRFACDPVPVGSDPTRVCPCGAPARVRLRLIPGALFDAVQRRYGKVLLAERAQWARGPVRHVAAVLIACETHERHATRAELTAAGLDGMALDARLAEDRVYESFDVSAGIRVAPGGQRAAFVRGAGIASAALSDELVAGLHASLGLPFAARAGHVAVEAVPPNGLVLYDTDADRAWLDGQLNAFVATMAPGGSEAITLAWAADVRARPAGRFLPARGAARWDEARPAVRPGAAVITPRGR